MLMKTLRLFVQVTRDTTRNRVSRDSVVGIATGYGLDGPEVGVRAPVGVRIFPPRRPDRPWGPPSLYPMDTGGSFPENKEAGDLS
jgi:hypothetical protein